MDVKSLVSQMTLEEKAGICSGENFWYTKAVERLGIPSFMLSDGPHGLRKQKESGDHLGINESIEAVCFPTGSAVASSFDRELIRTVGEALGEACQAEDIAVCLGPSVNIKRSPLCGRNFEYLSEDPFVTSEMAAAYIQGMQSKNVGTSMKHYLANNQEHRRMTSSSNVDERTLREIYLAAFEGAVKKGKPWTIMCSYNRINAKYVAHNERYLTDILRGEWGFDGFVVSDWGAVRDCVESVKAGLDLEMPSTSGLSETKLVKAVNDGALDETVLDQAAIRILDVLYRFAENKDTPAKFDRNVQHELARRVASESMVLLKNDGVLPLDSSKKIAFIGKFAEKPRYQGGGSSHINSHKTTSALEAAAAYADVTYAVGYDPGEDGLDEKMLTEALEAAKAADIAVIFAGLPDRYESEGYDRTHMSMPEGQNKLIAEICAVQPNTVVVLHNGSPVEMPWADKTAAILEAYLGGQAIGGAVADVLFGKANPSGKLAETFPKKLEDNPSYLYYTGEGDNVEYREGVFVGYRYYDKKKMDVLFPFGHGLSYTSFEYSNLRLSADSIKDTDTIEVSVDIKNTGSRAGKEVIQLYVSPKGGSTIRPEKELRGFEKLYLEPGETTTVSFTLGKRAFAYYCTDISDWRVETSDYSICVGGSSRDPKMLQGTVRVESTTVFKPVFTIHSTIGDILSVPEGRAMLEPMLAKMKEQLGGDKQDMSALGESGEALMEVMIGSLPLSGLVSFSGGQLPEEHIHGIIHRLNNPA